MYQKLLVCLLFIYAGSNAQRYNPDKVNAKVISIYNGAIELAQEGKWNDAKYLLLKAIAMDGAMVDAYLSYAGICGENKQYDSAIIMYEKARQWDSLYFRDYHLPYSINLAGNGRFEDALQAVDIFLAGSKLNERSIKAGTFRKRCYTFAIDMKKTGSDVANLFSPQNLGDNINTKDLEYFPSLPIEGNQLVFTRRVKGVNEDFFISESQNGLWQPSKPLQGINTEQNEGAQCISQDGEWLVFTGCNRPEGLGSCDIYISYKMPDGTWSPAENMGPNINTEFWESSPSLSPDKKDLYFTSRRPDGFGAGDIWVSHRNLKGGWTPAENLGTAINSAGEESAPFIHADNQTLYFTSDGLQGYGGTDLFISRKASSSQGWSIPQNLGYPINTIDSEGSLVVAADGETAYYASDRKDTKGGLDLYTFKMPENIRPVKTLWVKGKVFDNSTGKGLPSSLELKELSSGTVIENVQTDAGGNYLITLPVGKKYSFTVNRKGYLFFSNIYALDRTTSDSIEKNIPLIPALVNATIELKNILYETNAYRLDPSSFVELDKVVQLLKENTSLKIQISGHTDNVGKATDNLTLSNNRAKSVVNYLISKGIAAERLSHKGYGASKPVTDNATEADRAKNRRTELMVTGN